MKHNCGGCIDVLSVTKKTDNSVDVILVCDKCGEIDESVRYLYDDNKREEVIDKLSKLIDANIKTLNRRG